MAVSVSSGLGLGTLTLPLENSAASRSGERRRPAWGFTADVIIRLVRLAFIWQGKTVSIRVDAADNNLVILTLPRATCSYFHLERMVRPLGGFEIKLNSIERGGRRCLQEKHQHQHDRVLAKTTSGTQLARQCGRNKTKLAERRNLREIRVYGWLIHALN